MKELNHELNRAMCVLSSWLNASKILYEIKFPIDGTITLNNKVLKLEPITVLGLLSTNFNTAIKSFHNITEQAGLGKPEPVNRGPIPTKKLSYKDNAELVIMRHREFRFAPNLSTDDYNKYKKVIELAVYWIYSHNQKLFRAYGLEKDDLKQFALIWTTNYLHKYKILDPKNNDNERLLFSHLKKRFVELVNIINNKSKNCLSDKDAYLSSIDSDVLSIGKEKFLIKREEEVDEEFIDEHCELNTENEKSRRTSAAKLLTRSLNNLDHDKMIYLLTEASQNIKLCPDSRKEAQRRLRKHKQACQIPSCTAK